MEQAIIRALIYGGINSKIIYMAPTKSLCSERAKDWQLKFKPLGIECASWCSCLFVCVVYSFIWCTGKEFTGDTQNSSIAAIRKTTIM